MCIVVVDDEPELRELVSQVLIDEGYEVLSFAHPVPVTELSDANGRPHVFLLDIMLPEMNGIALAARLKDEGFEATPKIAMSASPQMIRVARESQLFHETLDKPFHFDDLVDCVGRYATGS